MEKLVRIVDRIANFFAIIAGIIMILGVVLVITEIIVRSAFNRTIYITDEYSAYFMVAITFLGLAYTLKEKAHIRMTFLHKIIKGGKPRFFLDLYAYVVGLAIFIAITIVTFNFFWDSVVTGTRAMQISRTYLAIPQAAMPIGSFLITLQFVAEILRSVIHLRKGIIGDEEVESQSLGR